jgi:uncharacterized protein (TIGR00725 family)
MEPVPAAASTPYVAVIGAGDASAAQEHFAEVAGRALARRGAVVVCGGLGGVMAAVARGAHAEGGTVVGLLPGDDRKAGSPDLTVALTTGLGEMRNPLVIRAADAVLAVGGGHGTLSELAFALRSGVPVVGHDTWALDGVVAVDDPLAAVDLALALAAERRA